MKPIIAGNIVNACIEFGHQTHEDVVTGPDAYPTAKQVGRVCWRWPEQRQVDNLISIFGYWILQSVSHRDTLNGLGRWRCRQRIAARPAVIRLYGHDADEVAFAMPIDIHNGKTIPRAASDHLPLEYYGTANRGTGIAFDDPLRPVRVQRLQVFAFPFDDELLERGLPGILLPDHHEPPVIR